MVKFLNGENDLSCIKIVLTDFEWIGHDSKGGTPIFASPECFDFKTNTSDIFSLGRVFLFMMLSKESFLKFLFVPIITTVDTNYLATTILNQNDLLGLIVSMMKTKQSARIELSQVRMCFDSLTRNSQITMSSLPKSEIERVVTQNLPPVMVNYISDLDDIS